MSEGIETVEYDRWDWHTGGVFPKNVPPAQGFVHIGMYLTWLILHGLLDPAWVERAGLLDEVASVAERRETATSLRDRIDGALTSEMLSPEGRAFTEAFYVPPDGFPGTWQRAFGRRADVYAVPDGWETYAEIEGPIDRAYAEWVGGGRPRALPVARRSLLDVLLFRRPPGH